MNTLCTTFRTGAILALMILPLATSALADAQAIPLDGKGLPLWEIAQWSDAPVRLELPNHAALDDLLTNVPIASFSRDQIRLEYTSPKSFHLVFEPRVTPTELQKLRDSGYGPVALPDLDRAGREASENRWMAQVNEGGKALATGEKGTYLTHAQVGADLALLADTYPDICRVFTWGQSIQGRDLWGIVISNDVDNSAAEPEVRLSSSMHGDEPPGMMMLVYLAHHLTENYNQASKT